MPLDIIQQEIYTGSINIRAHSCDSPLSLFPSAPYRATPHLSVHRIGCKHIPSYFAFPTAGADRGFPFTEDETRRHFSYLFGTVREPLRLD